MKTDKKSGVSTFDFKEAMKLLREGKTVTRPSTPHLFMNRHRQIFYYTNRTTLTQFIPTGADMLATDWFLSSDNPFNIISNKEE